MPLSGLVAGVDGCRSGWAVVVWGSTIEAMVVERLDDLVADVASGRLDALGLDMPLGLPLAGPRLADREARILLGPRRSSMFPTPTAACLEGIDYADANRRGRATDGRGISKQAYNLFPRIREARDAIDPDLQPRVSEVHPETSFAVMAGAPMAHPKRTEAGRRERVSALESHVGPIAALLDTGVRGARFDDLADAAAAAWTARRIATGTARFLGDDGRDDRGFHLTIAV